MGLSASFFRFLVTPDEPFAAAAGTADAACGCAPESCCEPFIVVYVVYSAEAGIEERKRGGGDVRRLADLAQQDIIFAPVCST